MSDVPDAEGAQQYEFRDPDDTNVEPAAPAPDDAQAPADGAGGVAHLVRTIAQRLHDRQGKEAVRTLLEGQAQGAIPSHDGLLHWLVEQLGEEDARRLIAAFAHFPCAACDGGGLEPCGLCEGEGIRAEGMVCESCIGGGRVRCDFCAGSGLATYNLVPPPLRRGVITHRVGMAERQVQKLPRLTLPGDAPALLNLVLGCNKLSCLLENAVTAARAYALEHPEHAAAAQQLIARSLGAAEQVETFVRGALERLASMPPEAGNDAQKPEYYRTLIESRAFERTLLHHPLLREPAE